MTKNVIYYVAILACILFFYFLPFSYAETDLNLVVDSGLMDKSENDLLRKRNYYTVLLGAVYWNNLADIEYDFSVSGPAQYGTFREWGYNFVEQSSDNWQETEYFEEDTIGGYLSLGVDFPISEQPRGAALRVESKVHFMNFGDLGGIASGAGDLKGPVYMFQIGITF